MLGQSDSKPACIQIAHALVYVMSAFLLLQGVQETCEVSYVSIVLYVCVCVLGRMVIPQMC